MGIFFRFGGAQLCFTCGAKHLTQRINQVLVLKHHPVYPERFIVFGEGVVIQCQGFHALFRKICLGQRLCYLSAAVCSVIETQHRIARLY